ncbi:hypothetical protein QQZ08_009618 [Neonectria magnoliae]|uniref:Uncharacterized protein n=1 Tax=Neonectria magnoliae TaxID=2732573 RepID=A0ABR1HMQ8_9HYPO
MSNNYSSGSGNDSYIPLPETDMTGAYNYIANTLVIEKAIREVLKTIPDSTINASRTWTKVKSTTEVILWAATESGQDATLSPPNTRLQRSLQRLYDQFGTREPAAIECNGDVLVLFWWRRPDVDDHRPMTAPADETDPAKRNWIKIKSK